MKRRDFMSAAAAGSIAAISGCQSLERVNLEGPERRKMNLPTRINTNPTPNVSVQVLDIRGIERNTEDRIEIDILLDVTGQNENSEDRYPVGVAAFVQSSSGETIGRGAVYERDTNPWPRYDQRLYEGIVIPCTIENGELSDSETLRLKTYNVLEEEPY